jgi:hypothetical protein
MKNMYDVNYRLKTASCMVVMAENAKQAKEKVFELLDNMSREELVERFIEAVDFAPNFTIINIDKIDDACEDM